MRAFLGVALLALVISSCGPQPAPPAPPVRTPEGKANVRACLQMYNNCTLPCYAMRSNSCVHRCNDALASCYATVE
jgi:hypothetical protein